MIYFCAVVIIHNATKVVIYFKTNMANTIILNLELPPTLPHGWKKQVAEALGIHKNTVTNALRDGKGDTYERIMKAAKEKYGKPIKPKGNEETTNHPV